MEKSSQAKNTLQQHILRLKNKIHVTCIGVERNTKLGICLQEKNSG